MNRFVAYADDFVKVDDPKETEAKDEKPVKKPVDSKAKPDIKSKA